MDQSPSIESLAAELKLPVRTLRARFAREAGLSIGRAIRRERLLLARTLLCNTSDSISSIASRCGFTSIYSFSRAFTHLTGQAPSKVRQGAKYEG
jgi:transcriptional regulator GlxA family with amidase domain